MEFVSRGQTITIVKYYLSERFTMTTTNYYINDNSKLYSKDVERTLQIYKVA